MSSKVGHWYYSYLRRYIFLYFWKGVSKICSKSVTSPYGQYSLSLDYISQRGFTLYSCVLGLSGIWNPRIPKLPINPKTWLKLCFSHYLPFSGPRIIETANNEGWLYFLCRGDETDFGCVKSGGRTSTDAVSAKDPTWTDMLVASASISGYVAIR